MKILTKIYKKLSSVITISIAIFLPAVAGAETTLENPLRADTLQDFLGDLVEGIVFLSIPVIVFFIIYAGFMFVTSGGDTKKIETAKKTALYTIIGAAIILGASLIAVILQGTFDSFQGL